MLACTALGTRWLGYFYLRGGTKEARPDGSGVSPAFKLYKGNGGTKESSWAATGAPAFQHRSWYVHFTLENLSRVGGLGRLFLYSKSSVERLNNNWWCPKESSRGSLSKTSSMATLQNITRPLSPSTLSLPALTWLQHLTWHYVSKSDHHNDTFWLLVLLPPTW